MKIKQTEYLKYAMLNCILIKRHEDPSTESKYKAGHSYVFLRVDMGTAKIISKKDRKKI